jgi:hypothetical protein
MTNNKKAARLGTGTASNAAIDSRHSTKIDSLTGWYSLSTGVKPSRYERTPKRSWKHSHKGRIDPLMTLYIGLMVLAALMLTGVIHA